MSHQRRHGFGLRSNRKSLHTHAVNELVRRLMKLEYRFFYQYAFSVGMCSSRNPLDGRSTEPVAVVTLGAYVCNSGRFLADHDDLCSRINRKGDFIVVFYKCTSSQLK